MRTSIMSAAALALSAVTSVAGVGSASPHSLMTNAMVIRKSGNRNQVCYSVAMDEGCAPLGPAPVRPYWRMLEQGADVTQPLNSFELRYLGLDRQQITGEGVTVALRALPARPIVIRTSRSADGQCTSSTEMSIGGVLAKLDDVYVKQKLFGIDYVLLTGSSRSGESVKERIDF